MTKEKLESYETLEEDVKSICTYANVSKVLFLSEKTYLYLWAEKDISAFSAWLSGVNDTSVKRLSTYFNMRTDKIPECIYIENENHRYVDYYVNQGYYGDELDSGAWLLFKKRKE